MEIPEAVRAFRAWDGAEAGAISQWTHQFRMVRSGEDSKSELYPKADVAKVGCCGLGSKRASNLERPGPVILAGLDIGGDGSF